MLIFAACTVVETTWVEPALDCHPDRDRDGFGEGAEAIACGGAAVADATDCDDADPRLNPDAPEVCDGVDQDCDGEADEDPVDGLPFYVDGDGDGYGDGATTACVAASGLVSTGGDCDDADPEVHPGAVERCDEVDDDCDGFASDSAGSSPDCPLSSCAEADGEGPAWILLASGTLGQTWCRDGWTLGFLRNSAATGSQGDFGAGEVGLDGLALGPAEASSSATPVMAWFDLNDASWDELRVAAWSAGAESYLSRDIPRSELRIAFGEDGYLLYGGASGYWWCGGDAAYTDSGIGAVNNPEGAWPDCKGHGSLGSGWDFSEADYGNAGLTLCGGDGSAFLSASWGGSWISYGTPGAAQAIWLR